MSISSHVVGIKPPNDKWKKMKAIWDSCKEAHVDPPREVAKFFDDCAPDPRGVIVDLDDADCVREWKEKEMESGFEVDLAKLPKDVTLIRFYNSY